MVGGRITRRGTGAGAAPANGANTGGTRLGGARGSSRLLGTGSNSNDDRNNSRL